jgi:hypothetical protein
MSSSGLGSSSLRHTPRQPGAGTRLSRPQHRSRREHVGALRPLQARRGRLPLRQGESSDWSDGGGSGRRPNLLFGSSGIVSRTLDHWRALLDDAFMRIENLSTELFKSRAETQKALAEKEKAERECIHAKLKLDQMQANLASVACKGTGPAGA